MKNYYDILWLKPWASLDEIKKAYRRLSMKNHPDQWGSEYLFKEVNKAYSYLKENHSEYKKEPKKNKSKDSQTKIKKNSILWYIKSHKITSIIKVILIIVWYFILIDEFPQKKLRDFIDISYILFTLILIYYNEIFSKKVWFNVYAWILAYLIVVIPFAMVYSIEDMLGMPEFSIVWVALIWVGIKLLYLPIKTHKSIKKYRFLVYLLIFAQIISYTSIL